MPELTENETTIIPPKCYISSITFNNGETLHVKPNDIILFVGPNNVGKSQTLKDIYGKTSAEASCVVINDLRYTKEFDNLETYIRSSGR